MSVDLIAVVGPTASGKSDLAIHIANELGNTEIVNADAMQLYRGMDIGTAKLDQTERQGIPHHLIDIAEINQEITAVQYQQMANDQISEILGRNKTPILVGGSMFYIASTIDVMDFSPTDDSIRERLELEAERIGALELHLKLKAVDPVSAERIPAQNVRRVIRALEVVELTGQPYPSALPEPSYQRPTLQLGIMVDREVLKERIRIRVERMWQEGLLNEVEALLASGLEFSRTAKVAIGYDQAIRQLRGEISQTEAIEETISLTNRYARRQMSWFRRDTRIQWLNSGGNLIQQAMDRIRLVK